MGGWTSTHLSDSALDAVGTDDQVPADDLARRERDTWPALAGVDVRDGGTEPEDDIAGVGDGAEEEPVQVGSVNMVVRRAVVVFHAMQ